MVGATGGASGVEEEEVVGVAVDERGAGGAAGGCCHGIGALLLQVDLETQPVEVPHERGGASAEQAARGVVPLGLLAWEGPEDGLADHAAGVERERVER